MSSDIGLIGLAVMGENLALNIARNGFKISVFNRTIAKVDAFVEGRGKQDNIIGTRTPEEFAKSLSKPRVAIILVKAGYPVDGTIKGLLPFFEEGDIIIDGGNSNYNDTERRSKELTEKGILFVGAGVSGGEEGALHGPSIMPGGAPKAWPRIKNILQTIAAKAEGEPCCEWISSTSSGHYVKMVHNGIEYGDMQMISEVYFIMKNLLAMSNEEIGNIFAEWNKGVLDSYLMDITKDIMVKKDDKGDSYVLDVIMDTAGQKGTGKWTAIAALDLGMPLTLIGEAVFARCLSSQKEERIEASSVLPDVPVTFSGDKQKFIADLHDALYASKIVSYAQGFVLLSAAAREHNWEFNYGEISNMWRGGCIIRSKFLGDIRKAFLEDKDLKNLILAPFFKDAIIKAQGGWRNVAATCMINGMPAPAMTSALAYYDGYRIANGSANMIQAQRDYFGAHTYERKDEEKGKFFHTDWTGHGGNTTSGSYAA